MRRFSVAGFFDGKNYVVLPEFADKKLFPTPEKGRDCGEPLLAERSNATQAACAPRGSGLPTIDSITITAGGSVQFDTSDADVDVNVQGTWINTSGATPGPMYALSCPLPAPNCIGSAASAVGATITAIASYVAAKTAIAAIAAYVKCATGK